jgi:hypothetical protein
MKLFTISKPKIAFFSLLLIVSVVSVKLYADYYNQQQQIFEQKKKDDLLRWSENERRLKELEWAEKEKQRELVEEKKEQEMVLKRKQFVPYIQNEIIKAEIFGKKVFVKQKSDRILYIKVEGILGDNEGWLRWHKPNKPYDYYYLDAEKLGFTKVIILEECTNWKFNNYTYNSEANWHYETEWRNESKLD